MKKNNKKAMIVYISAVLLISFCLFYASCDYKKSKSIDPQKVLTDFKVDKLFSIVLSETSPSAQNLLDPNYPYFDTYFYSNYDFTDRYISVDGDRYYFAKYGDYVNFVRNNLGDSATKSLNNGYSFSKLTSKEEFTYEALTDDLKCYDLDSDSCYILFTPYVLPRSDVEFDSLAVSGNKITGNASRVLAGKNITVKFEFKFKEINNKRYATSLIINPE